MESPKYINYDGVQYFDSEAHEKYVVSFATTDPKSGKVESDSGECQTAHLTKMLRASLVPRVSTLVPFRHGRLDISLEMVGASPSQVGMNRFGHACCRKDMLLCLLIQQGRPQVVDV